jgi:hypothetical protein
MASVHPEAFDEHGRPLASSSGSDSGCGDLSGSGETVTTPSTSGDVSSTSSSEGGDASAGSDAGRGSGPAGGGTSGSTDSTDGGVSGGSA